MSLFHASLLSLPSWRVPIPALGLLCVCAAAFAQTPAATTEPANVVQLAASGFKEVQQDWLIMRMNTTREGADAATVQNQLKAALDAALAVAKVVAQPQRLELRTGPFSLHPRYSSNGKINGWQGITELVLEGRDFARIRTTAGKIQTLTVGSVDFSLSREAQQTLEFDVQAMAIERFKLRAGEVAKGFGFSSYALREISIGSSDQGGGPVRPRMEAMSDTPVSVEAGKNLISVTVSGRIQLR